MDGKRLNESYLVVINDQPMGDALCAMAAVQVIAKFAAIEKRAFYLATKNKEVELLLRPPNALTLRELPSRSRMEILRMDMGYILGSVGRIAHPIFAYMDQVEWPHDDVFPEVYFNMPKAWDAATNTMVENDLPEIDILIHPYCEGNPDLRLMPLEKWQVVFDRILHVHPEANIGILGHYAQSMPWPSRQHNRLALKYIYSYLLMDVIRLLRSAACVVTTDSGMNRLAHLAGVENHIILQPRAYPEFWVTHPGAVCIPGAPMTWNPNQIADAILQSVQTKEEATG